MSGTVTSNDTVVFFGSHAVDHYVRCQYWPSEGQKINAVPAGRVYGGMIPNAASIYAGYGLPPTLMGPLQDNEDADPILAEMASNGIDTRLVRRSPQFSNSYAYNFLSERNAGEKTLIIIDPGYEFALTPDEHKVFTGAKFIYSTIAHLGRIAGIRDVLAQARANGARLFIDVEAESFHSAKEDWWAFSAAHFVSFNDESIAKFRDGTSAEKAIGKLLEDTGGEVILTRGKEGCEVHLPHTRIRIAGHVVSAVDPLGAGDTFNSTYLYGRACGWSVERSAHFANAAAARSTTLVGPRSGRASVLDVEEFIRMSGRTDAAAAVLA
ncbi:carbohydrate kinase family protein [Shinella yambaruensis]|uniref:Ribokinase n=1 Tax=Shinella yambaruensis TaxID=415996 RepID=A0ABQ5ZQD0_9HYPH|nr:carbohydrate kinase family protein [Shinella yambaruensis]MCJ8028825.1 carbohydrate kinase family protein [Shinella yambaruensis]MCU7981881.1 carbohydrate kinase family protein [Shinella yambaruensis]GLR54863.1 ribokinase [Shinella yambaruensis]